MKYKVKDYLLYPNEDIDESIIDYIDNDVNNIIDLIRLLSGGTHGPAGKFSFEQLQQAKKRVEHGINFLYEISA